MSKTHPVPDEDASDPEPNSYGAVLSPFGTVLAVPRALGHERPKPEPEQRWTLGPGRHEEPDAEGEPDSQE